MSHVMIFNYPYLSHDTTLPVTTSFSILHYQNITIIDDCVISSLVGCLTRLTSFVKNERPLISFWRSVNPQWILRTREWVVHSGGNNSGCVGNYINILDIYIYIFGCKFSDSDTFFWGYLWLATWLILVVPHFQGETAGLPAHQNRSRAHVSCWDAIGREGHRRCRELA